MEFPDDVLVLIRAYSKPAFQHFREYNHALKVLGKKKWPMLKYKLEIEPSVVVCILPAYLESFVKKQEVYRLRDLAKREGNVRYDTRQMHTIVYRTKREEEERFADLVRIVYGYGKTYLEVMEDML